MNNHKRRIELEVIGEQCKKFRIFKMKKTQKEIAKELEVTQNLVSMFEKGQTDSAYILSYYIKSGVII